MKITSSVVLIGMAFVAAAASAQAPAKKTKPGSAPKAPQVQPEPAPPPPPPFVPVLWDAALPATAYQQNTPELVYRWLEEKVNAVPGKVDAFSSTADRAARDAAVNSALAGMTTIAFPVGCTATYDGDKNRFTISRITSPFRDISLKSPPAEKLTMRKIGVSRRLVHSESPRLTSSGTLVGEHSSTYHEFVLGIPAGPANEPAPIVTKPQFPVHTYTQSYMSYVTFVPMPAEEAREQHKQIGCLAVMSLQAPYLFTYAESEISGTFPRYYTENKGFGLFGKLDRWAVVNMASGKTYVEYERDGL